MPNENHYQILKISRKASLAEIKTAFRNLAKKHHPDNGTDKDEKKFREISTAYETLSNKNRKDLYDLQTEFPDDNPYIQLKKKLDNNIFKTRLPTLDPRNYTTDIPLGPIVNAFSNLEMAKVLEQFHLHATTTIMTGKSVNPDSKLTDALVSLEQENINRVLRETAKLFLDLIGTGPQLHGWLHTAKYIDNSQLYIEKTKSAMRGGSSTSTDRIQPGQYAAVINELIARSETLAKRFLQRMEWIRELEKDTKQPFDIKVYLKALAADHSWKEDATALMNDGERIVGEMLANHPQKFNNFRQLQRSGSQWPHSPDLRREIERAGFVFRPMMIKRDRCVADCCNAEFSGWRPWHYPPSFHKTDCINYKAAPNNTLLVAPLDDKAEKLIEPTDNHPRIDLKECKDVAALCQTFKTCRPNRLTLVYSGTSLPKGDAIAKLKKFLIDLPKFYNPEIELEFTHQAVTADDICELAGFLREVYPKTNTVTGRQLNLVSLNLSHNPLGDEGALYIAYLLFACPSLRKEPQLMDCNITEKGKAIIQRAFIRLDLTVPPSVIAKVTAIPDEKELNKQDEKDNNNTRLHKAAEREELATMVALSFCGASLFIRNNQGQYPLELTKLASREQAFLLGWNMTALMERTIKHYTYIQQDDVVKIVVHHHEQTLMTNGLARAGWDAMVSFLKNRTFNAENETWGFAHPRAPLKGNRIYNHVSDAIEPDVAIEHDNFAVAKIAHYHGESKEKNARTEIVIKPAFIAKAADIFRAWRRHLDLHAPLAQEKPPIEDDFIFVSPLELIDAIQEPNTSIAEINKIIFRLKRYNIDLNTIKAEDGTPLIFIPTINTTHWQRNLEIIRILIENGVTINDHYDLKGNLLIHRACKLAEESSFVGNTALNFGVELLKLLIINKVDVNARPKNWLTEASSYQIETVLSEAKDNADYIKYASKDMHAKPQDAADHKEIREIVQLKDKAALQHRAYHFLIKRGVKDNEILKKELAYLAQQPSVHWAFQWFMLIYNSQKVGYLSYYRLGDTPVMQLTKFIAATEDNWSFTLYAREALNLLLQTGKVDVTEMDRVTGANVFHIVAMQIPHTQKRMPVVTFNASTQQYNTTLGLTPLSDDERENAMLLCYRIIDTFMQQGVNAHEAIFQPDAFGRTPDWIAADLTLNPDKPDMHDYLQLQIIMQIFHSIVEMNTLGRYTLKIIGDYLFEWHNEKLYKPTIDGSISLEPTLPPPVAASAAPITTIKSITTATDTKIEPLKIDDDKDSVIYDVKTSPKAEKRVLSYLFKPKEKLEYKKHLDICITEAKKCITSEDDQVFRNAYQTFKKKMLEHPICKQVFEGTNLWMGLQDAGNLAEFEAGLKPYKDFDVKTFSSFTSPLVGEVDARSAAGEGCFQLNNTATPAPK